MFQAIYNHVNVPYPALYHPRGRFSCVEINEKHRTRLRKEQRDTFFVPTEHTCSLTAPLRCWLTAICRSQDEKKPLMEVVKMEPELQEYYDNDAGFAQFVQRHGVVAAMPDIHKAYRR